MAKKTLALLTLILLILSNSALVFAANNEYLYPEKWHSNSNVTSEEIRKTSRGNALYGDFSYFVDNSSMTVYTNLFFNETTLSGRNNDIRVQYEFFINDEVYTFSVDSNGVCEGDSELFNVGQKLYYHYTSPQMLSYAQYKGKSKAADVSLYLFVNSTRYLISDNNISLLMPEKTKASTIKKVKTTKKKTTKRRTTKMRKSSSKSGKTTKRKVSSTKFNKSIEPSASKSSKTTAKEAVADEAVNSGKYFNPTNYIIIFSCVMTLIALMIIIYNAGIAREKRKNEDTDSNEDK